MTSHILHILIQLSVRRPHVEAPTLPESAHYDSVAGCWNLGVGTEATIGPPMTTKKNDIETGEDMKGE